MKKLFGANWKTTLTGGVQALATAVVSGALTFPSDWSSIKQDSLFGLVVIGTFFGVTFAVTAKSKDVTGGTVAQTSTGAVAPLSAQIRSTSIAETKQA
jgi:hypothetical protein